MVRGVEKVLVIVVCDFFVFFCILKCVGFSFVLGFVYFVVLDFVCFDSEYVEFCDCGKGVGLGGL